MGTYSTLHLRRLLTLAGKGSFQRMKTAMTEHETERLLFLALYQLTKSNMRREGNLKTCAKKTEFPPLLTTEPGLPVRDSFIVGPIYILVQEKDDSASRVIADITFIGGGSTPPSWLV